MSSRPRLRGMATLLVALLSAVAAADVLQFTDGKLLAGKVVSLDDAGVTFAPERGGEMRVSWERVVPRSRFDLWEGTLAAHDAPGRVALAKWALSAELYLLARREFVKAKGLGYAGTEKLDDLIARVDREEADSAISDADSLVAAGELQEALDRVRTYLKAAPPGAHADHVRARVPDILARIERRDALEKEQQEAHRKAEKDGKLRDWIERNLDAAAKQRAEGSQRAIQGFSELTKGNHTRARAELSAAETAFQDARTTYRRVKKSAGTGTTADECDKLMDDCDRRTVEVLVRLSRMEVENKAWKRASPLVDRGLKIDPVDRELLDLRREIDENWIRRKLSDVTNARPREN